MASRISSRVVIWLSRQGLLPTSLSSLLVAAKSSSRSAASPSPSSSSSSHSPSESKLNEYLNLTLTESQAREVVEGSLALKTAETVRMKWEAVCGRGYQGIDSGKLSREHKWVMVVEHLQTMGVEVDSDLQLLLQAGDVDMAIAMFDDLYALWIKLGGEDQSLVGEGERRGSLASQTDTQRVAQSHEEESKPREREREKPQDTNKADTRPDVLSLVAGLLAKEIGVDLNKVSVWLTTKHNVLIQLVQKGTPGAKETDFKPLISWLRNIYSSSAKIIEMVSSSPASYTFVLQVVQICVESSNMEVAMWACRILSRLAFELPSRELADAGWTWLSESGVRPSGMESLLGCFYQFEDTKPQIALVVKNLARYDFRPLFITIIPKVMNIRLDDDNDPQLGNYVAFVHELLSLIMDSIKGSTRGVNQDSITQGGLIDFLLDIVFSAAEEGKPDDLRAVALECLAGLWMLFPKELELNESGGKALDCFRHGSRSESLALQIVSLTMLFHLLEHLASTRNKSAPLCLKILVFALIEYHDNEAIQVFIMNNLALTLQKRPDIPIQVVIEPLIKQYSEGSFGNGIFDFFIAIAKHAQLPSRHALLLIHFLGKVALHNLAFGRLSSIPFLILVNRLYHEEPVQNYIEKYTKVILSRFMKAMERIQQQSSVLENPQESKDRSYYACILATEILTKICHLRRRPFCQVIKPVLESTILEYKALFGRKHEALESLSRFLATADMDDSKDTVVVAVVKNSVLSSMSGNMTIPSSKPQDQPRRTSLSSNHSNITGSSVRSQSADSKSPVPRLPPIVREKSDDSQGKGSRSQSLEDMSKAKNRSESPAAVVKLPPVVSKTSKEPRSKSVLDNVSPAKQEHLQKVNDEIEKIRRKRAERIRQQEEAKATEEAKNEQARIALQEKRDAAARKRKEKLAAAQATRSPSNELLEETSMLPLSSPAAVEQPTHKRKGSLNAPQLDDDYTLTFHIREVNDSAKQVLVKFQSFLKAIFKAYCSSQPSGIKRDGFDMLNRAGKVLSLGDFQKLVSDTSICPRMIKKDLVKQAFTLNSDVMELGFPGFCAALWHLAQHIHRKRTSEVPPHQALELLLMHARDQAKLQRLLTTATWERAMQDDLESFDNESSEERERKRAEMAAAGRRRDMTKFISDILMRSLSNAIDNITAKPRPHMPVEQVEARPHRESQAIPAKPSGPDPENVMARRQLPGKHLLDAAAEARQRKLRELEEEKERRAEVEEKKRQIEEFEKRRLAEAKAKLQEHREETERRRKELEEMKHIESQARKREEEEALKKRNKELKEKVEKLRKQKEKDILEAEEKKKQAQLQEEQEAKKREQALQKEREAQKVRVDQFRREKQKEMERLKDEKKRQEEAEKRERLRKVQEYMKLKKEKESQKHDAEKIRENFFKSLQQEEQANENPLDGAELEKMEELLADKEEDTYLGPKPEQDLQVPEESAMQSV